MNDVTKKLGYQYQMNNFFSCLFSVLSRTILFGWKFVMEDGGAQSTATQSTFIRALAYNLIFLVLPTFIHATQSVGFNFVCRYCMRLHILKTEQHSTVC